MLKVSSVKNGFDTPNLLNSMAEPNLPKTCTEQYSWRIFLNFISRVIGTLFSSEAGNTNEYFADMMGKENTKPNIQKMLATQYTVEYWLTLVITSRQSTVPHIASLGKDKIPSVVSPECIALSHHVRVENS